MFELVARFSALFGLGLAAGGSACIFFIERAWSGDGAFFTQYKQLSIRALTGPLPAFGAIGMVGVIAMSVLLWRRSEYLALGFCLSALVLNIVALWVTRSGHFPINGEIMGWQVNAPPRDWMATQARWASLHVTRTVSAVLGFVCVLLGELSRRGS